MVKAIIAILILLLLVVWSVFILDNWVTGIGITLLSCLFFHKEISKLLLKAGLISEDNYILEINKTKLEVKFFSERLQNRLFLSDRSLVEDNILSDRPYSELDMRKARQQRMKIFLEQHTGSPESAGIDLPVTIREKGEKNDGETDSWLILQDEMQNAKEINEKEVGPGESYKIKTGIGIKIPKNYFGLILPRSKSSKLNYCLGNTSGIIDSDYLGEIITVIKNTSTTETLTIRETETYFQLLIVPCLLPRSLILEKVEEFSEKTERDSQGFGHSDNKK